MPRLPQPLQRAPYRLVLVQAPLVEIRIHANAKAVQRPFDVGENGFFRRLLERRRVALRIGRGFRLGVQALGNVCDIGAQVAILGKRRRRLHQPLARVYLLARRVRVENRLVSRPHGLAQHPHLAPGVVEIIFPRNLVPAPRQQIGYRIAKHGIAAMAHGQGSGGIRADVLDQRPLTLPGFGAPERLSGRKQRPHPLRQIFRRKAKVDES